ncbi:MAG: 1-phosphofructokinase family hexose kinase [Hyphomonadaceae bacterium]|nr:1-phosphofructokinase family hexose kinase [Clostridia bacterium]
MILVISLNPAIDRTVTVENFQVGSLNRVVQVQSAYCGKAINVARALHTLGDTVHVLGFAGGEDGRKMASQLEGLGIANQFVYTQAPMRVNIKIADGVQHTLTELNEAGAPISEEHLLAFLKLYHDNITHCQAVVMSGSIPPGVPLDFYATLIEIAKGNNILTVLDSSGQALLQGVQANPHIIKPNLDELNSLSQHPCESLSQQLLACEALVQKGVDQVLLTRGGQGAVCVGLEECLTAQPVDIAHATVKSTVGAGDCFLAGYLHGIISQGLSNTQALTIAASCGTAMVQTEGTTIPTAEKLLHWVTQVKIIGGKYGQSNSTYQ